MERYKGISSNSKSVSCSRVARKRQAGGEAPEARSGGGQAGFVKCIRARRVFANFSLPSAFLSLVVVSYLVGIAAHFSRLERKGGFPDRSSRERDKVFLPFGLPRLSPFTAHLWRHRSRRKRPFLSTVNKTGSEDGGREVYVCVSLPFRIYRRSKTRTRPDRQKAAPIERDCFSTLSFFSSLGASFPIRLHAPVGPLSPPPSLLFPSQSYFFVTPFSLALA